MIEVSFREKIVALQQEVLRDPLDVNRNHDFWAVMDSISDELATKWADRATKIRVTQTSFDSHDWLAICNILHDYNNSDDKTLRIGQKRKLLFHIIRHWDDLEMNYFC